MDQTNIKQFKVLVATSLVLPRKIKLDLLKIAEKLSSATLEKLTKRLQESKKATLKHIKEVAQKDPQKLKSLLKGTKKIKQKTLKISSKTKRKSINPES